MTRHLLAAAAGLCIASAATAASAATWAIDPAHTNVQFSVRHMMLSNVTGEFGKVSGSIQGDQAAAASAVIEATIDASSINTREPKRDEHLKSPDFLDVAKYPTITFKSKKIEPAGAGSFKVTGDLTLHGVTRPVTLNVVFNGVGPGLMGAGTRMGFSGVGRIKRSEFNVTGGRPWAGDDVDLQFDVEFVRK